MMLLFIETLLFLETNIVKLLLLASFPSSTDGGEILFHTKSHFIKFYNFIFFTFFIKRYNLPVN